MIEKIKQNIDIVELIERYTELRGSGNCLQAKTNPLREEKTASFSVYRDTQKWQDFGSGEHGDVIDFIERAESVDRVGAIKFLSDAYAIGLAHTTVRTPIATPVVVEPVNRNISKDLAAYASNRELKTFKNKLYKDEALNISPMYVYSQASKMAIERFNTLTEWDSVHNTILIKISDYEGNVFSTKHRRKNDIKWCTAAGTSPNRQCLINITAPRINPIYIVEGHHDFLTAVLLSYDEVESFNVLMIPTVNYKKFNQYELDVLKDKDVYFLPDLKRGDRAGVEAMRSLMAQVGDIAANTKLANLDKFLAEWEITVTGDKLDLSEAVELWQGTARAFTNSLQYYCDRDIHFEKEAF